MFVDHGFQEGAEWTETTSEEVETYGTDFANYGGPKDPALYVTCQLLRNFGRSGIFKSLVMASGRKEQMENNLTRTSLRQR